MCTQLHLYIPLYKVSTWTFYMYKLSIWCTKWAVLISFPLFQAFLALVLLSNSAYWFQFRVSLYVFFLGFSFSFHFHHFFVLCSTPHIFWRFLYFLYHGINSCFVFSWIDGLRKGGCVVSRLVVPPLQTKWVFISVVYKIMSTSVFEINLMVCLEASRTIALNTCLN